METIEFQATIIDGKIEIPESVRDRFPNGVHVIMFANKDQTDSSSWPKQNRRRWELIAKNVRHDLTKNEEEELALLQKHADEQLAEVRPRPTAELERLYEELTRKE